MNKESREACAYHYEGSSGKTPDFNCFRSVASRDRYDFRESLFGYAAG